MNPVLSEILEIPDKAMQFLSRPIPALPLQVPYLGMGSSYFAPLAFKYMGIDIYPELASEYFNYLSTDQIKPMAVILSQSGKSSEALWCSQLFEKYIAISNYPENALSNAPNTMSVVDIGAGPELFSSSKTYVNTLLLLFKGFGLDPSEAISVLVKKMEVYRQIGDDLANQVFGIINTNPIHGIYITGSGPNVATALEAALIMSESTKLNFHGLAMAQYDHGPKETAENSIVIQVLAKGKSYERTLKLGEKVKASGAHVLFVEEQEVDEKFSILHNIVPFNFMAFYLAERLGITQTFSVGGKVTEVL